MGKFFLHSLSHLRKESDPELDPDPSVRGADPRIRIRTKMSPIPNTGADIRKKGRVNTVEC
jgi:hypothetical protein